MNSSNSQKRRHKSNPGSQQTQPLNAKIEVEPNTHNPDLLWETLKQLHPVYRIGWSYAATQPPDSLRFVCISDTHAAIESGRIKFANKIPNGDILLHAGDFTMAGMPCEITSFNSFMGELYQVLEICLNFQFSFARSPCT